MTQEELDQIPEMDLFSYRIEGNTKIPVMNEIRVCHVKDDDAIYVVDSYGQRWTFAIRKSDGVKVKIRENF